MRAHRESNPVPPLVIASEAKQSGVTYPSSEGHPKIDAGLFLRVPTAPFGIGSRIGGAGKLR
jgi:hypothetical protein